MTASNSRWPKLSFAQNAANVRFPSTLLSTGCSERRLKSARRKRPKTKQGLRQGSVRALAMMRGGARNGTDETVVLTRGPHRIGIDPRRNNFCCAFVRTNQLPGHECEEHNDNFDLPMAQFWGGGVTASSDGQFFPTTRHGEAMNLINAKYGQEPGLKAYTHVSDQFGPFATQNIPTTVKEAPYILDGLLMNEVGQRIKEQYADTGGFTDHVFAATALLSYRFVPRIRDLPSNRLYLCDPAAAPREIRGLVGGKIREKLITENWPDILRAVATMAAGVMPPSQLLRKFASYPRQHELAVALRELGRIERSLFIIDWLLDADMQRRAQIGLNKGEAHHALKNALRIGRQGEIRDRTSEGQHYRMAGLNLLAAVIVYWNTKHLGHAVAARKGASLDCSSDLLTHISPLGWAHILLTGEYRWKTR